MGEESRSYYAIIPANVRYDSSLNSNAKLLYGEITALCNQEGYCWATNDYFSKLYGVSKTTISRWIRDLKNNNYISVELIYKKGSKEIDYRYIRICGEGINKNDNTPINKNDNTPIDKNDKENNTSLNNTSLNNKINNTYEIYSPAEVEQKNIPYIEIIDYLNFKTGRNYNAKAKCNRDAIKARFNEGATLEDFKNVIDKKVFDWLKDKKMNIYLRPTTLFGTKFDSYLNQSLGEITTGDLANAGLVDFSKFRS